MEQSVLRSCSCSLVLGPYFTSPPVKFFKKCSCNKVKNTLQLVRASVIILHLLTIPFSINYLFRGRARTLTQSQASKQYPCRRPWNRGSWKWRCLYFYCISLFMSAHYESNISLKRRTHVNTRVKEQKTSFHFPHPERSVGAKQLASSCMWLLLPDCLVCLHEWVQMFIAPLHVHRG